MENEFQCLSVEPTDMMIGGETTVKVYNPQTGEYHEAVIRVASDKEEGSSWWWKLRMDFLISILDELSGKQSNVLKILFSHVNYQDNMIFMGVSEIAKLGNCSKKTVEIVINLLRRKDIVRRAGTGVLMVNPEMVSQGKQRVYFQLLDRWNSLKPHKALSAAKREREATCDD